VILCDEYLCAGVGQDVLNALGGIDRVDGHVSAAGLQDAEDADHHLDGTVHVHGNQHVRSHAQPAQVMGQLVGARVQLAVGQRDAGRRRWERIQRRGVRLDRRQVEGDGVGRGRCLGLEQAMDGCIGRELPGRGIPARD